jgi:hypothetical protein
MPKAPAAPQAPEAPVAPQAPVEDTKNNTSELTSAPVPPVPQPTPAPAPAAQPAQAGPVDFTKKPEPHFIRTKTQEKIFFTHPDFKIGKSNSQADFTIKENTAVSRVHAIIAQKNGVNYIVDNNSTNGTYVDGEKIEPGKEVLLKNGTVVWMGGEEFIFKLRRED